MQTLLMMYPVRRMTPSAFALRATADKSVQSAIRAIHLALRHSALFRRDKIEILPA